MYRQFNWGEILACQGLIPQLYVHMGFHPSLESDYLREYNERHVASDEMK